MVLNCCTVAPCISSTCGNTYINCATQTNRRIAGVIMGTRFVFTFTTDCAVAVQLLLPVTVYNVRVVVLKEKLKCGGSCPVAPCIGTTPSALRVCFALNY